MQSNDELLSQFEETFQQIDDGHVPRPDMFGYSRLARQMHKVETAVAHLVRVHKRGFPLPSEPETAYERWHRRAEDDEFAGLFGEIYRSNPTLFVEGGN